MLHQLSKSLKLGSEASETTKVGSVLQDATAKNNHPYEVYILTNNDATSLTEYRMK